MIPADLAAGLIAAVRAAIAAGELPPQAGQVVPSGTWRPAPPGLPPPAPPPSLPPPGSSAPGPANPEWPPSVPGSAAAMARRYATSLPFTLSRIAGREPREVAAGLGGAVAQLPWVSSAEVTGAGYLTIEVTPATLADVAVRVSRAGLSCACGGAVGDPALRVPASTPGSPGPPLPDLAGQPGWPQAGRAQAAAVTARLRRAAATPLPEGCRPPDDDENGTGTDENGTGTKADAKRDRPAVRQPGPPAGPVASAVSFAGADAVRYWLTRSASWPAQGPSAGTLATRDLANPWYAVTFAQADAAATRRRAADLGLWHGEPGLAGERLAGLLGEPAELALLGQLSWLGERVAGAARRARPADLARYLEEVSAAWLDCREACPALPFGGAAAPRTAAGISARLLLAGATAAALAAGLLLTGVAIMPDSAGL
ncbi:MAG TPA: DALR anticodon-binding domain-containing protein [Streptosporangiaceae bacterium]|nr:DALR anticodon-binding domain-containing protein [Streptosporangiaceae bacterium]